MTDGIPAKTSMMDSRLFFKRPVFNLSPNNNAVAIENGKEIKIAITDVNKVPIINGSAPNVALSFSLNSLGSQVSEKIKGRPNLLIDG